MMLKWTFLALIFALTVQTSLNDEKPEYTQDLEKFRTDKYKIRMEMLVGCWLMSREYLPSGSQQEKIILIKSCLRHISRKDSINKITSLIGKNMTSTKKYQEIVPKSQIPQLHPQSVEDLSQFDSYLIEMLKKYELDLVKVQGEEGKQLIKKVEQEVQKRSTKYFFGIIPANKWTHLLMLVTISLILAIIVNCWKYLNPNKAGTEQKKCQKHQDYFKNSNDFTKNPNPSDASKKTQ